MKLFNNITYNQLILLIMILIFAFCIIIVGIIVLKKYFKNIKISKSGVELKSNYDNSSAMSIEIMDYRNLSHLFFIEVKNKIKYMIKTDNWILIKDWEKYKLDTIKLLLMDADQYFFIRYYQNSLIMQEELTLVNEASMPKIKTIVFETMDKIKDILKKYDTKINLKTKELDDIINNKDCYTIKNEKCVSLMMVSKLTTEILIESRLRMIEDCMIEVETSVSRITQMCVNEYCKLYGEKIGGKK